MALYRGTAAGGVRRGVGASRSGCPREEAYLAALETLAAHAVARGDPATAVCRLRQAVAVDPLRETAQQALLKALVASGDYIGALLAYRAFRLRLHQEVRAEPSPETKALFHQLRAQARRRAGGRAERRDARRPARAAAGRPLGAAPPAPAVQPVRGPGDSPGRGRGVPGKRPTGDAHRAWRCRQDPAGDPGGGRDRGRSPRRGLVRGPVAPFRAQRSFPRRWRSVLAVPERPERPLMETLDGVRCAPNNYCWSWTTASTCSPPARSWWNAALQQPGAAGPGDEPAIAGADRRSRLASAGPVGPAAGAGERCLHARGAVAVRGGPSFRRTRHRG